MLFLHVKIEVKLASLIGTEVVKPQSVMERQAIVSLKINHPFLEAYL